MAKVTSKYQVTVPKAIADQYNIRPGDDINWTPAGDVIRVTPRDRQQPPDDPEQRLRLFDQATGRLLRGRTSRAKTSQPKSRGWTREDLYTRGRSR